jgi:3-methyladenine DNA glycosylase Mpg
LSRQDELNLVLGQSVQEISVEIWITRHIQLPHGRRRRHSPPGVLIRNRYHEGSDHGNNDKTNDIGYEFHVYAVPVILKQIGRISNGPHNLDQRLGVRRAIDSNKLILDCATREIKRRKRSQETLSRRVAVDSTQPLPLFVNNDRFAVATL